MKWPKRNLLIWLTLIMLPMSAMADAYCFEEAGNLYGISPVLLKAISQVESNGDARAVNMNTGSGSKDIGHMQVNSFWLKHLNVEASRLFDACYCTMAGAWILSRCVDRYGYNWTAVACYHTGRGLADALDSQQRKRGQRYIEKVQTQLAMMDAPEIETGAAPLAATDR